MDKEKKSASGRRRKLKLAARPASLPKSEGTKQAFRYPYVIAVDAPDLYLSHCGFYLTDHSEVNSSEYTIHDVSVEINGVAVPVTYGGERSKTIYPGDVDRQSDAVPPSVFGLERFRRGDILWVKGNVTMGSDEAAKPIVLGSV